MDSEWNDNASTGSTDLVKLAEIQRLAQQLATVLAGNARTLDAVQSQAMELVGTEKRIMCGAFAFARS